MFILATAAGAGRASCPRLLTPLEKKNGGGGRKKMGGITSGIPPEFSSIYKHLTAREMSRGHMSLISICCVIRVEWLRVWLSGVEYIVDLA